MKKQPLKPWHEVAPLREDLLTGELSQELFAADLYEAALQGGRRPLYEDPRQFFTMTYPTQSVLDLAREVAERLAGTSTKAVFQLSRTYGGGKTHALITLLHLLRDPANLPADVPTVQTFLNYIKISWPVTRVAVLSFDKLGATDAGIEVRSIKGNVRTLRYPWAILAYQLADAEGLRLIHGQGQDAEDEAEPGEEQLFNLLSSDVATLILMDEVLMYAQGKVDRDPVWLGRLSRFFRYLTAAVTRARGCALIASLLANEVGVFTENSDKMKRAIESEFSRVSETPIEPIRKGDIATVLRRRFFSLQDENQAEKERTLHAVIAGIAELDQETRQKQTEERKRFAESFPFHPDVTEVFYAKWTDLPNFQEARGVLRVFAEALREAQQRGDNCPLVATNVFLSVSDHDELSKGAMELAKVAAAIEYDGGAKPNWSNVLVRELEIARNIQAESQDALLQDYRVIEQAVFAVFLHSQPASNSAWKRDMLLLLGPTAPDKIKLEQALRRWTETSWHLDESTLQSGKTGADGVRELPAKWHIGYEPNLRQMHDLALKNRVDQKSVEQTLQERIEGERGLKAGIDGRVRSHFLPESPDKIQDDGDFHYAVLNPDAASEEGAPSDRATRYLAEKTDRDHPRVHRNAVVLAVPSMHGIAAARDRVRDWLGWQEVRRQLVQQYGSESALAEKSPDRARQLKTETDDANRRIPEAIQQAYCVAVTIGKNDQPEAFRVSTEGGSLFERIRKDKRTRIQEGSITADALLPGGPYNLWRDTDSARRVDDLVGAFSQNPKLPKMLSRQDIRETLKQGCLDGWLVFHLPLPKGALGKTYWREEPEPEILRDPGLGVILPEKAILTRIAPTLLSPGRLPELWPQSDRKDISLQEVYDYFAGGHEVEVAPHELAYVPKARRDTEGDAVAEAVKEAVKAGYLWLTLDGGGVFKQEVPTTMLVAEARLQGPPAPIPVRDLLAENLPEAWKAGVTTDRDLAEALSAHLGVRYPVSVVREALEGAYRAGYIEIDGNPSSLLDEVGSQAVVLRMPETMPVLQPATRIRIGKAILRPDQIQDLSERIGDIVQAAVGLDLKFQLQVEVSNVTEETAAAVTAINTLLTEISESLCLE